MYTVLTFQVAVGIIAGNLDGTSLDTCLVSFLQVGDGGLIAVSLGIAQIHTHQHACPVLALRTTGTRVNFQHTVHLIGCRLAPNHDKALIAAALPAISALMARNFDPDSIQH